MAKTSTAETARNTAREAVLRPDITPTRTSTPEQKAAARLQQALKENPDPGRVVDAMAQTEPIGGSQIAKSGENYDFKDGKGNPNAKYDSEKTKESTAVQQIVDLIDNGNITVQMEQQVLNSLVKIPGVKESLQKIAGVGSSIDLNNTDIKASVDKILEGAKYRQDLRDALKTALEHSITDLGEAVGVSERARDEARRKLREAQDELDKLNDTGDATVNPPRPPRAESLAGKKNSLREYEETSVGYKPADTPTNNAEKIVHGEHNLVNWNSRIRVLSNEKDNLNAEISKLEVRKAKLEGLTRPLLAQEQQDLNDIPDQVARLSKLIIEKEDAIAPLQDHINELTRLQDERAKLKTEINETIPQKINQLTGEIFPLNEAYQAAEKAFKAAEKAFDTAINERLKSFENMIGDQAAQFIRAEITYAETREKTRLDGEIAKAEAAGDKQMADLLRSMETRWSSPKEHRVQKWKDDEIKVDKEKVRPDFDVLLSGGPDELGKAMFYEKDAAGNMVRRVNPDTGRRYTKDEIDATMQKDSFKNVQDEAVQRVLGNAIKLGLTDGKEGQILQSAWGVAALQKAREWNKAVDEQLKLFEKHSGIKNILDPKNIAEMTKKHKKFSFWLLLTMMSPGLGFIVGSGLLTKNMLTSDGGHGEKAH